MNTSFARHLKSLAIVALAASFLSLLPSAFAQSSAPPKSAKSAAQHQTAAQSSHAPAHSASANARSSSDAQITALLRRKIKYLFVIYQENRSFDSYFGTFPGANGLYSRPPKDTPGFYQPIINTNGSFTTIHPFRIGPPQFASDLDDVDHAHPRIVAKMNIVHGVPQMNRFALMEEVKRSPLGKPSLQAKQMAELTMAHEDCDTIPFLWRYAHRFVLFDHIFQEMAGPSTLGNLVIIAAQTGQTQWALHPGEAYKGDGSRGPGVPVMNDSDPFWGSQLDSTPHPQKMPVNPRDMRHGVEYETQMNLTFATLPLTFLGGEATNVTQFDRNPARDLADIHRDIAYIPKHDPARIPFGWFQEGYDSNESPDAHDNEGPLDAFGLHAGYVTHHNSPQYFGYIANNPKMRSEIHGIQDFFNALAAKALPRQGGLFFVKGGSINILHLKPGDPDAKVQKNFQGDDDHPGYSDSQISEALIAETINKIAASPYWRQSAIMITWDDSEGDYDHVPPPIYAYGPDGSPISDGPRVPFILISPYARTGYIDHAPGNQASVAKFADLLFSRTPLALLPDELRGRALGEKEFHQKNLGPEDALTPGIANLTSAFSLARLEGKTPPLSPAYVEIPDDLIHRLPAETGYGCRALKITPTDRRLNIPNDIPSDFNPRPLTDPSPHSHAGQ